MDHVTPRPNDPVATVCVVNLPSETSEADLRELFSGYGPVQRVTLVSAEADPKVQGHGYLELSSGDVERAIAGIDGYRFKGSVVRVSRVAQMPTSAVGAGEVAADVVRPGDDQRPAPRARNRYEVANVEKALVPDGGQGGDWYRYVLSSGCSQIAGLHRGTLEEVTEYAESCAELVNSRSVTGKSTRTCTYSKKKAD
jgi:RNA recognition motif-containing protein